MINLNDFQEPSKKNKLIVIYLMIFSIILTPDIDPGRIPSFRIEQIIVSLFFVHALIKVMLGKPVRINSYRFPLMFLGLAFFTVLSIFVGAQKGIRIIPNDFFELYKIFVYLGIYLITDSLLLDHGDKLKVLNFMRICLVISVMISVQQYFNLFGLNEVYVPLIAPTQARFLINDYPFPRVVGLTSNPNEYAIMPGIGVIVSWAMYSLDRNKRNLAFMAVFILGVLMTLSRSGFIFVAVGIVMYTILYFFRCTIRRSRSSLIIADRHSLEFITFALLMGAVMIIAFFTIVPEELTWRLIRGLNLSSDSSFQARLTNWVEHIDYFKMSPVFGLGPAKAIVYQAQADNEWLLFLRRYGVVGCTYIALIFFVPFRRSRDRFYSLIYFSTISAAAVYMLVANIYSSFQVVPLIIILAAMIPPVEKAEVGESLRFSITE